MCWFRIMLPEAVLAAPVDDGMKTLLASVPDTEIKETFSNLGGHDLPMLLAALSEAERVGGGVAIIAYTVKGWGLPSIIGSLSGHWKKPTTEELAELQRWGAPNPEDVWEAPSSSSEEGKLLALIRKNRRPRRDVAPSEAFPTDHYSGPELQAGTMLSPQEAIGAEFAWLASLPPSHPMAVLVSKVFTLSADVAFSAGLCEWVNARRVWGTEPLLDPVQRYGDRPEMDTRPSPEGQHIRLSNVEQFMGILAASLGKGKDFAAQELYPIAFFYDIFLERFVEMFKYAAYWDSRCWFIGTISGLSAPSESGLHHSLLSGAVGNATPNVVTWEPGFPEEVSWIFAEEFRRAFENLDEGRRVRYFKASALPVKVGWLDRLLRDKGPSSLGTGNRLEQAKQWFLEGGCRVVDSSRRKQAVRSRNVVTLVCSGPMIAEGLEAAELLEQDGIYANVVSVSCAGLLSKSATTGSAFDAAFPMEDRTATVPVVTICDGHPASFASLLEAMQTNRNAPRSVSLGVTRYDRSGTREELLGLHGLSVRSIAEHARSLF